MIDMWKRPFYSVGLLFRADHPGDLQFLGCSFAFRTRRHFVTAAHCLGTLRPEQLNVVLPLVEQEESGRVSGIDRHPEADLAVVRTSKPAGEGLEPFRDLSSLRAWGEPVQALGYPEETEAGNTLPTARLFTGSIQRFSRYESHLGYRYRAGELSFGSPAGLSGGPVFPTQEPDRVLGVVTENRDATTFLRSISEIQQGDDRYSERIHELIRYGVFVDLASVRDWLLERCGE